MNFPTDPQIQSATAGSEFNTLEDTAVSLNSNARWRGGHRFTFVGQFTDISMAQWRKLWSFLQQVKGAGETFKLVFPQLSYNTTGDATGTCRVNNLAGYPIGTTSIAVDGHAGTIAEGAFITIGTYYKAYTLTADRAGAGAMTIAPPLLAAISDNDVVSYDAVEFTVRASNKIQFPFPAVDKFTTNIEFRETKD